MRPYRIIYAGTPDFAVPSLAALLQDPRFEIMAVLTQPDRPAGRGHQLQTSAVKKFALQHQLPLLQPASLKNLEIQQTLKNLAADVMIVAAYGLILPIEVLEIPYHGCINIHGSLLPKWRGAAPVQRAIEAGDLQTGISIMQMEKGLDTGPVFYVKTCPITAEENAMELISKLSHLGAEALMQSLPRILNGTLHAKKQDDSYASYAKKLEKIEGLIDWQQAAENIARRIRAFYPWPGCYFSWQATTIKIGQAKVIELETPMPPGTLLKQYSNDYVIACGTNALQLIQIQLPGKKMGPATEVQCLAKHQAAVAKEEQ